MQEVIITVTRIPLNQHMDPYNTKLILSCLKQTPTLGMVTPTRTITLKEADKAQEALVTKAVMVAIAITETAQLLIIDLKGK